MYEKQTLLKCQIQCKHKIIYKGNVYGHKRIFLEFPLPDTDNIYLHSIKS